MRVPMFVQACSDDEEGAVTVDWVVLTASIVVLGTGVISAISPGLTGASSYIESEISSAHARATE